MNQLLSSFFKKIILLFLKIPESPLKKGFRDIFYGDIVNERIIEYPLIFSFLEYKGESNKKVIDIGCYFSNLPISLASLGYQVVGVNLQDYQLTHPNFRFIKSDIRDLRLKEKFDIATAVSTIEHIGTGFYNEAAGEGSDKKSVEAIRNLLKNKGKFLITVPFGRKKQLESFRSYDWESLKELLNGFNITKSLFFKKNQDKWLPVRLEDALKIDNRHTARGLAFVLAEKK